MGVEPANAQVSLIALASVPRIMPGDDLPGITLDAIAKSGIGLENGDVFVFAQKVVSKAEGRSVSLRDVIPSVAATELAGVVLKDPRLVELILQQSSEVIRAKANVLIVRNHRGLILANAGIDASNVESPAGEENVLLLPRDPDASADRIRQRIASSGIRVAVIINDSIGRAWRLGTIGTAIGVSGLSPLLDMRGMPDLTGRALRTTEVGFANEIASAASMIQGQAAEGRPIVLVRGLDWQPQSGYASDLIRPSQLDLFR